MESKNSESELDKLKKLESAEASNNLLREYQKEYAVLKEQSPEEAKEYLIKAIEGIYMQIKNEVFKEELKKVLEPHLNYMLHQLSDLAEKDGIDLELSVELKA